MSFDRFLFSATIKAKLSQDGISGREAARATGVSASTMSRLINGEVPDMESFATIVEWLEADANLFIHAPRGGEMRDSEKWTWLYLCLNEFTIPKDLIEAIVTILRLIESEITE